MEKLSFTPMLGKLGTEVRPGILSATAGTWLQKPRTWWVLCVTCVYMCMYVCLCMYTYVCEGDLQTKATGILALAPRLKLWVDNR